jgi:hypothetical protein
VSTAGTVPRGDSTPGEAHPPRRVVLLSESAGLATVLGRLLDRRDQLTRIGWPREVAEQGELDNADLVVLDVPDADRIAAVDQLRRRYRGPVVVFVERGDNGRRLPPDQACTLLARPFSADELRAALGLSEPGTGQDRATPRGTRDAAARRPAPTQPAPLPAAKRSRPGAPSAPSAADAPAALAGKAPTLVAPPAGTGRVVSLFPAPAVDDRAARRLPAPAERKPVADGAAVVEIPAAPMEGRPALGEGTAPATGARPAAPGGAPAGGPAVAAPGGPAAGPTAAVVDGPPAPVHGKAAARPAPPRPGAQPGATPPEPPRRSRLAALVAGIVDGWRTRRAVRIAGLVGLAAVAFMVAFVLAAQGRCGPGCDALTGIITPAKTLPAAKPPAAPTTTPRKPPPSTTLPPSGSGYRGVVPGGAFASTTSTTRRATTTSRRPTSTTRRATTTSATTTSATTTSSTTTTTTPPATP